MPVRLDARGVPVTTDSSAAVALLEHAIVGLAGHRADTAQRIERALDADPGLVAAHCIAAFAYKALGRTDLEDAARARVRLAQASLTERGGSPREHGLVAAIDAWCRGEALAAVARLEHVLDAYPTDLLAFKLTHAVHFILGRPLAMRAAIERVLHAWDEHMPGFGYVLGCHAFALEETEELERAEAVGRRAVALEPLDAWGAHAVAHVMERQDRSEDGLRWMDEVEPGLDGCNNFGGHLAWHRSLLHLQRFELDQALALHDERIAVHLGRDYRDVANAATLLWRLEHEGMAVGDRWQRLAELARERIGDHGLAFADAHYALALASSGDLSSAARFVASMREAAAARTGFYAQVLAEVGVPLAEGIVSLAAGSARSALERMLPVSRSLIRLGGSHAQRDIFAQILIEAAVRSDRVLARRLLDQRLSHRPDNRYARSLLVRARTTRAAA